MVLEKLWWRNAEEQQAEVEDREQGLSMNFHLPRNVVTPWLGHELCEGVTTA